MTRRSAVAQRAAESGNRRQTQRGQAATELVVLCAVLIPMFFLFPLVGKYLDLYHQTEEASRYVAFEATVHPIHSPQRKTDATLSQEVARRFFSNTQAHVRTGEPASNAPDQRLALWQDHKGHPLLKDLAQDVKVSTSTWGFNVFPVAEAVWDKGMQLPKNNGVTASVTVTPHNLPGVHPFDNINIATTRTTSILTDTWAAQHEGRPKEVVEKLKFLYPSNIMEDGPIDIIRRLPRLFVEDPLPFGMPDWAWGLLPCDRLQTGDQAPQCP